jgi:hypothetical protein
MKSLVLIGLLFILFLGGVRADPLRDPSGTSAFFVLGVAAAADKRCGLKTYRIVLMAAKTRGLTDFEIAQNAPEMIEAALQVDDEIKTSGLQRWCASYQHGMLTGK